MNTGITVKGINGELVFVVNEELSFCEVIKQLESLLDKPLLKNNGFYPKALFDFKCRIIEDYEFELLIKVLLEKEVVLFGGIIEHASSTQSKMRVIHTTVRSGQVLELEGDVLLIGNVNPGGLVRVEGTLYVMGRVSGTIEGRFESSRINGQYFDKANIKICGVYHQEFTSLDLSLLYYKDNEVLVEKGEMVYV